MKTTGNEQLKTTNSGQRTTDNGRIIVIFFLITVAFYFYGIGSIALIGPDEPRYAQVAREMYERKDLVTPTLGGRTWFEKPALLYWMAIASFAVFGVSEWAARFGPACAGLLSIFAVYWMGRRVEQASKHGPKTQADEATQEHHRAELTNVPRDLGLWSALALASTAGMIIFSRAISFDVVVTMTMTLALACFFVSGLEREEKKRRWLLAGFYAGVGASLLAKGLIGVVIPGGVICAYFLLQRRWPERRLLISLLWGVPLALIVAAIWYGPVIQRNGWKFVDEFFIQHHFARYVSNKYRHPGPFYYYLPTLLLLALPWSLFLLSALAKIRRWNWRADDALSRFRLFALAWMVVPVAFFSISGSKLPGYILPVVPAAAFLIGERLSRIVRGEGKDLAIRVTGVVLVALALGGVFYARREGYTSTTLACLLLGPLFIAGLVSLIAAHLRRLCLVLTAGVMLLTVALAVTGIGGLVSRRESSRELLRAAEARGYASSPVYEMHVMDRTAEFYASHRLVRGADGDFVIFGGGFQALDAARLRAEPILVLIPVKYIGQLTEYALLSTEVIAENDTNALVAVRARQ